jgi:hypothetical protein
LSRAKSGSAKRGAVRAANARRAAAGGVSPQLRPLRTETAAGLARRFELAVAAADGPAGAHCIHEWWMRGEFAVHIEAALARLWQCAAPSIPEWLPMRHIDWLPLAYEVAAHFHAATRGRSNLYMVLLDFSDRRGDPHGVYVGMTSYAPAQRFDQHKQGLRASGSVLKRGLELLVGPVLHLQRISRVEAARFEGELADALRAAGLMVEGGH